MDHERIDGATTGTASAPQETLSALDRLREQRERQRQHGVFLDRAVPSWPNGQLVARYRVVSDDDRAGLKQRAKARAGQLDEAAATTGNYVDLLVTACVGLYLREDDDTLTPIPDPQTGMTCRYDGAAADLLGVPVPPGGSSGDVLRALFDHNPTAIDGEGMRLDRWTQNPQPMGVDEDPLAR